MKNVYIHVPFCNGKCAYCALYSVRYRGSLGDAFMNRLEEEFSMARGTFLTDGKPDTIYVGGGTPSVLDRTRLERLMKIIPAGTGNGSPKEWSVEVSPDTISEEKMDILLSAGVNRVSMGVQSFDDRVLRSMNRRHTGAQALEGIGLLKKSGIGSFGIDLIASLPGVTAVKWRESLELALSLEIPHVSVYSVTVENGTELQGRIAGERICLPGEEAQIEDLDTAEEILTGAGYRRYEISNYSLPGHECLHNLACWRGEDYAGFGPGASGRHGRERWTNTASVEDYTNMSSRGKEIPRIKERLSPVADMQERMLFGFRLEEGVDLSGFRRAGDKVTGMWRNALEELAGDGLVEQAGARWRLTPRGRSLADSVLEKLAVDTKSVTCPA